MKRAVRVSCITPLFLALIFSSVAAETKNYYFPQVRIDIGVERDGSFIVDESRTYDFEGSFTWASLRIPLSVTRQGYRYDISIEDFRISDEQGQALPTETTSSGGDFEAKWSYQARNEQRTFHIHYRVRGGIVSYPDVSELYWQAIGSKWDKPTKNATVNVTLPEPAPSQDDLLVFGHGPLSGWAQIVDPQTARFTATDLRSRQFFEIRLVWPGGMVTGVPSTRQTRDSIRREEARFVTETIEKVRRAQARIEQNKKLFLTAAGIWGVWLVLGSLIWFFFYLKFWKRVGKDYHFSDLPEYYRELPSSLQPAFVEVLLKEGGSITPRSFTATLFDLARRGYLELLDRPMERRELFGTKEEIETTITLKKAYANDEHLLTYEKDLLELLFETISKQGSEAGAHFELEELKEYFKKRPQKFQTWYQEWAKTIKQESKRFQFIEPQSLKMRNIFLGVTIPVAVLTLNPVLGVLGAIFIPRIKRREMNWARENELWKRLHRFLDDFSDFKEVPAEAYRLWEHYLVFAIIFGNAKKILKILPVILQDQRAAPSSTATAESASSA